MAMTAALLLLMAYGLVGEEAHEWIGMGMFFLFILHHILNRKWLKAVPKGRYTPFRIFQTVLAALIFFCMIGSMVSGIILSRYVFTFLPQHGGYELAGRVHILSAYWGFVLMSIHLGLHWNMMLAKIRKQLERSRKQSGRSAVSISVWIARVAGYLFAAYGVYAFWRRDVGLYLFLKSHFVFFDYSEPVLLFLFDYLAVMGSFVVIGYWAGKLLRKRK